MGVNTSRVKEIAHDVKLAHPRYKNGGIAITIGL